MDRPDLDLRLPSPLVELVDERLGSVRVLLKRDDLIHPEVTGNKWRKLRHLLVDVARSGATTLLTFGGAYSNHVRAVAAVGRRNGLDTIGVIRGDERPFNEMLAACVADGMRLHYVDRATYRRKTEDAVVTDLRGRFGDFYLVPEGGTTVHALPGCAEIVTEIDAQVGGGLDIVMCPVGTGGTLAGLSVGLGDGHRKALGISVLKGAVSLDDDVRALHSVAGRGLLTNWSIDPRFHHGGFARRSPALDLFLDDFRRRHGLLLDHVYVGKMMFALFEMVASGEIPPSSVVVAVITGTAHDGGTRSSRQAPELMA